MSSTPDDMQASTDHADDHQHHVTETAKVKTFKDKCNRCAPCCIGAAIPTELAFQITTPAVAQDFPALTVAEHSIDRGRLDRPPQAFLT